MLAALPARCCRAFYRMDLARIEAVLRILQRQDHVAEVSVDGEGWRLLARKGRAGQPRLPLEPSLPVEELSGDHRVIVRSALVGIYRAAAKSARRGDFVPKGATLGNIDSMRIL